MTNFVPYEIIINDDKYFPWISNRIKKLIHKQTIFVRIITKMMTLLQEKLPLALEKLTDTYYEKL